MIIINVINVINFDHKCNKYNVIIKWSLWLPKGCHLLFSSRCQKVNFCYKSNRRLDTEYHILPQGSFLFILPIRFSCITITYFSYYYNYLISRFWSGSVLQGCHFQLCQWKLKFAILVFSTSNNLKFSKNF